MNLLPKPLAYFIMGMVSLVWFANFVLQFLVEGYESDPLVHGIFMSIVGGAIVLQRKDAKESEQAPPPPAAPPAPAPPPEVTEGSG